MICTPGWNHIAYEADWALADVSKRQKETAAIASVRRFIICRQVIVVPNLPGKKGVYRTI